MSPDFLVTCVLGWIVDHVELGDAVAVAAALISLVALYFAAKSAKASIQSAAAADRSAEASEQSVAETRAARSRAERPQFKLTAGEVHEDGDDCPVTVTMIDGPTMITVRAHYIGEMFFSVIDGVRGGHPIGGQSDGSYELVKNDSFVLRMTSCRGAWSVDAKVILLCKEVGEEGREWHHAEQVRWNYQPPPATPLWA